MDDLEARLQTYLHGAVDEHHDSTSPGTVLQRVENRVARRRRRRRRRRGRLRVLAAGSVTVLLLLVALASTDSGRDEVLSTDSGRDEVLSTDSGRDEVLSTDSGRDEVPEVTSGPGGPVSDSVTGSRADARRTGDFGSGPSLRGDVVWTRTLPEGITAAPSIGGDNAIVRTTIGVPADYHAVDAGTGIEQWSYGPVHAGNLPAESDGEIVVLPGTPIVALDAQTGGVLWTADLGMVNGVAIADDSVVVASYPGLQALELETGAVRWARDYGVVFGPPTVAASTVFVADRSGLIRSVDLATGTSRWEARTGETCHQSGFQVVAEGGYVLAPATTGLFVYDAETGTLLWEHETPMGLCGPVAVADMRVYLVTGGSLRALDLSTGTQVFEHETGTSHTTGVSLAGDGLYLGTGVMGGDEGAILAVDRRDGTRLWTITTEAGFSPWTAPIVLDGRLLIGDFGGTLWAIQ